eukprot:PhM_4_TR10720/c0_g1_i1/m.13091
MFDAGGEVADGLPRPPPVDDIPIVVHLRVRLLEHHRPHLGRRTGGGVEGMHGAADAHDRDVVVHDDPFPTAALEEAHAIHTALLIVTRNEATEPVRVRRSERRYAAEEVAVSDLALHNVVEVKITGDKMCARKHDAQSHAHCWLRDGAVAGAARWVHVSPLVEIESVIEELLVLFLALRDDGVHGRLALAPRHSEALFYRRDAVRPRAHVLDWATSYGDTDTFPRAHVCCRLDGGIPQCVRGTPRGSRHGLGALAVLLLLLLEDRSNKCLHVVFVLLQDMGERLLHDVLEALGHHNGRKVHVKYKFNKVQKL